MAETMYAAPGVGLAATQVDVHKQPFIADVSEDKQQAAGVHQPEDHPPERRMRAGRGFVGSRCLRQGIGRAKEVTVEALDRNGKAVYARCRRAVGLCQHELDHLLGRFVEYPSRLKQERIAKKLKKTSANPCELWASRRGLPRLRIRSTGLVAAGPLPLSERKE